MMTPSVSERAKATLLLTAPLLPRANGSASELLRPREYRDLLSTLSQTGHSLEDLVGVEAREILQDIRIRISSERLSALLARGVRLADAIDRWRARGIWVIGLGDPEYPLELVERLGAAAPSVLYGCGDVELLRVAGLAIVGSRDPSAEAVDFARTIAEEAARSQVPVVSGGARGIDASAMRSALQAGGNVVGILAQRLDRAAVAGENREYFVTGQLLLLSPYDPSAGFNVGNAMARNKLIYAFAKTALVACADHSRGGTWAGAIEQLDQSDPMPLYVRDAMEDEALAELVKRGAMTWPLAADIAQLACQIDPGRRSDADRHRPAEPTVSLFEHASQMLLCLDREYSRTELQGHLEITPAQLKAWLPKFLDLGVLEQTSKRPLRYRTKPPALPL
ncbi:MAG: DNA-processing protein DprA [Chloroflexi bacterium]|nr:DNA-processing protein DprA [Chloroflexota bacterium]MCY3696685.1 DNA-processing protein DprA [Chloroflexota bacterium]